MLSLKIGALAELTGTNAPTIRYYEEIGLLRPADRQSGGQRVYGDADVKRLTFIHRCREFGFSIDQVRALVMLVQDPQSSCLHARDLAQEHLVTVRAKLSELKALERSISAFVASCNASCAGGPGSLGSRPSNRPSERSGSLSAATTMPMAPVSAPPTRWPPG
jgi:DNA-binding transcriptional MerR regulator